MKLIRRSLIPTAALLAVFAPQAFGTVIGNLEITSGGQAVIVGMTFIDWGPAGPGGTINTTTGTTVTYDGGSALSPLSVPGNIVDLVAPTPPPTVVGFMTFAGNAGLSFDLEVVGPGDSNIACAALLVNQSCSVFPGSPFVLTRTASGTSITLSVSGIATDNLPGMPSIWLGSFTTQIPGRTPGQIQADFGGNPNFTLTSPYSGSFLVIPTPEPATAAFIGIGLLALGAIRRRRA